jgi:hypothetical protein
MSDEICNRWYGGSRRLRKHPVTGETIDPDGNDFLKLDEGCSKRSIDDTNGKKRTINIPDWDELEKSIKQTVADIWSNDFITKRCTFNSPDEVSDKFDEQEVHLHKSIICADKFKVPTEWKDFKNINDRKDIESVLTNFTTTSMFGDTTKYRIRFLRLVTLSFYTLFQAIYIHTADVLYKPSNLFLVLKGGISIRMNIMEMIRDLSGGVEDRIMNLFRDDLKLSDFDFEIYDQSNIMSNKASVRICNISYLMTMLIRNHMDANKSFYLEFFNLSTVSQKRLIDRMNIDMQTACDNISDTTHFFHGVSVKSVTFYMSKSTSDLHPYIARNPEGITNALRTDLSIIQNTQGCEEDSNVCFISTRNVLKRYGIKPESYCRESVFYTTHNPWICFSEGIATNVFQLNRIKCSFRMCFERPNGETLQDLFSGEILDVSNTLNGDTKKSMFRHNKEFGLYPRVHSTNMRHLTSFELSTLTPYGQYVEHMFMLFYAVKEPWKAGKAYKRSTRLILLLFLFVLSDTSMGVSYWKKLHYLKLVMLHCQNQTSVIDEQSLPRILTGFIKLIRNTFRDKLGDDGAKLFYNSLISTMTSVHTILQWQYNQSRNPTILYDEYDPSIFANSF